MRHQLTVDLALTDSPGNQQAVLGAEVNDNYGLPLATNRLSGGGRPSAEPRRQSLRSRPQGKVG